VLPFNLNDLNDSSSDTLAQYMTVRIDKYLIKVLMQGLSFCLCGLSTTQVPIILRPWSLNSTNYQSMVLNYIYLEDAEFGVFKTLSASVSFGLTDCTLTSGALFNSSLDLPQQPLEEGMFWDNSLALNSSSIPIRDFPFTSFGTEEQQLESPLKVAFGTEEQQLETPFTVSALVTVALLAT
jgi:hypothetical protein